MSGAESGAVTLVSQASDVIFRVKTTHLNATKWVEQGAGKKEWRGTEGVPRTVLEYRRNLGTSVQKTWRSASVYPKGLNGVA
ncbi:hypothetical protein IP84_13970 [beta proteobacterium AAP99]|nr:hypothetical protein IP84_13970 [beta proteobacterium AAP99]